MKKHDVDLRPKIAVAAVDNAVDDVMNPRPVARSASPEIIIGSGHQRRPARIPVKMPSKRQEMNRRLVRHLRRTHRKAATQMARLRSHVVDVAVGDAGGDEVVNGLNRIRRRQMSRMHSRRSSLPTQDLLSTSRRTPLRM